MSADRHRWRIAGALPLPAIVWVLASLAVPHAILGQTRIGSEFQVNSYTIDSQTESSVAADPAGNFVVVGNSGNQDGGNNGVFAQQFSSTGAALGEEFQVNEFTTNSQWRSSVASDADGDFVISWQSFGNQDGEQSGVFARRFSSAGAALGDELQVNNYTGGGGTGHRRRWAERGAH